MVVDKEAHTHIATLDFDNGDEYTSNEFKNYLS